ncbi:MAG: TolB protein [Blastocatellia bacterium]|jgi:Tol biopolymer transport system component|nr:TolB protein [Blastocatellia bacterium]
MRYLSICCLTVAALLCLFFLAPDETTVRAQGGAQPRKLAFTFGGSGNSSTEIYVVNSDGTGQTRLTNNGLDDRFPAWSPDGAQIIFESNREGSTFNIYRMNADGSNQIPITASTSPWSNFDPAWSPDGNRIAFVSNRAGAGQADIWTMRADGNDALKLTTSQLYDTGTINEVYGASLEPAWSPDGSKIAFTSRRDGNFNLDIYVMNADGSSQTRLTTNAAEDRDPTWSPDGSKIAFTSTRDGNHEIYVMNADGSNQVNVTNFPNGNEAQPSWSQDGRIAFMRLENRNNSVEEIYAMNADGSSQTRIVSNGATSWTPAWQTFSSIPTPTPTPTPIPVYSVSGRVVDSSRFDGRSSPGIGGITLTLGGTVSATTQTDAGGNYSFGNLPENGTFTLTPTNTSWGYYPSNKPFTTDNRTFGFVNRNLTVNFDASPIYLEFISATYYGSEGTDAYVTVTRNGYTTGESTIDYATSDNSALAGLDYVPASGSIHFAPGETMKGFTVHLNNDDVNEGNESINLTLSNPTGSVARGRMTASLTISGTAPPLLLTEQNSEHAIALNAATWLRDPFSVVSLINFGVDQRTRVALFAQYADLQPGENASVLSVQAEDAQHRIYTLPVEYVGAVPNQGWVTQIVVKLPDEIAHAGDVWLSFTLRGIASNRALLRIN